MPHFANASGVTSTGNVSYITAEVNGVLIQLKDENNALVKSDPDGCGRNWLFMLVKNHPNYDALYSTILSSFAAGMPTKLKLEGCTAASPNGWPIISYVQVGEYTAP